MSELRQAIDRQINRQALKALNGEVYDDEAIDAILDAFEAALPEEQTAGNVGYHGWNTLRLHIKGIINEARKEK